MLVFFFKALIKRIQLPVSRIFLNLPIPFLHCELFEPSSELSEICRWKFGNRRFDFLDDAHVYKICHSGTAANLCDFAALRSG